MMIEISELVSDPDFAQPFTRIRESGSFVNGRWVKGAPVITNLTGVIQPSSAEDRLRFLPEGERTDELIRIWCADELRMGDGEILIADLVEWQGQQYRVIASKPWQTYGYYQAWAVGIGST